MDADGSYERTDSIEAQLSMPFPRTLATPALGEHLLRLRFSGADGSLKGHDSPVVLSSPRDLRAAAGGFRCRRPGGKWAEAGRARERSG